MNIGTSTRCGSFEPGYDDTRPGAGVSNVNRLAALSTPPVALLVPSGTSTLYVVACGNRISGSNRIVRVPIHRHLPRGSGVSLTGVTAAASFCEVTATIGWLNVTLSSGASGTLPSGIVRRTWRSLPASLAAGGSSDDGGAGNALLIVWPVRGGGCDPGRSANAVVSAASATSGLARPRIAAASASGRRLAGTSLVRSNAGAPCLPLDSCRSMPSGRSLLCTSTRSATGDALPTPIGGPLLRPPHDGASAARVASAARARIEVLCAVTVVLLVPRSRRDRS